MFESFQTGGDDLSELGLAQNPALMRAKRRKVLSQPATESRSQWGSEKGALRQPHGGRESLLKEELELQTVSNCKNA